MKRIVILIALIIPLLSGCKKDPEPEPVDEYTMEEKARDGLYEVMQYYYLWYDKMPVINVSNYYNPAELLEAVRYLPFDRWSEIVTWEDYQAFIEGSLIHHGITYALDATNKVCVAVVNKLSDLWPQGVRRGWILKKINGTEFAPIMISGDYAAWTAVWGPRTVGYTNTLLFVKPDGTEVTMTSAKKSLTVTTVTCDTVYDRGSHKIAYLSFDNFVPTAEQELNESFAYFRANDATDLIVDLRYNTGGYIGIAVQLASLILDNTYKDKVMFNIRANANLAPEWDRDYNFIETENPLSLKKVVFITTGQSASASELIISSLKPYIEVTLVGGTTYGKPAGQSFWEFPFPTSSDPEPDYKYAFVITTFEFFNSLHEGRFYSGIPADITANDDMTRALGDTEELSLKAALAVIEGTKAASDVPYLQTIVMSEGTPRPGILILDFPKSFKR